MSTVSVIIPTYNRLPLLIETLDNILRQTISPYEIIVVDNGDDGTFEHLKKHYSEKVIVLKGTRNTPGAGRNLGLKVATGKYIQFFDSDDVMTRNKFEVQIEKMQETNSGLVYCPYVHVLKNELDQWQQKDVILQYRPIQSNKTLHMCMVKGFFTIIPGFLFTKEFLKDLGYWEENLTAYEDWDYLWRIGHFEKNPPHTNHCAVFYRIHSRQTTGYNYSDMQRDNDKLFALNVLYRKFITHNRSISKIDKMYYRTIVFNTMKKNLFETSPLIAHDFYFRGIELISFLLRIENKMNRFITRSDWQIMHGVSKDKELFNYYCSLV